MNHERWITMLVALLVVATGVCLCVEPAAGQTDDEVRSLIDQLDTQAGNGVTSQQALDARRAATDKLEGYIAANRLTPDQLALLRTYPAGPPLELLKRKELILATWTMKFPEVSKVIDAVQPMIASRMNFDVFYKFDGFFGVANVTIQGQTQALTGLYQKYEAARNALAAADTNKVAPALVELKNFVDNNFNNLDVYTDAGHTQKATKMQLLDAVQSAIDATPAAIQKIQIGSNNVQNQPPRMPEQVNQRVLDSGITLRLALLNNPVMAGGLDIFLAPYALALALPPPGYQYAGELFDLLSTDTLDITGNTVAIGLEYGSTDLFDNPITNPQGLRMARMANGQVELFSTECSALTLPCYTIDTSNSVITGFYRPESIALGPDQFGEFFLVQAVPEPSSVALLATGCLGLLVYCWRRW